MKKSRLTCDEWHCITSKRFTQIRVEKEYFTGVVAGLFIDEFTKKCFKEVRSIL